MADERESIDFFAKYRDWVVIKRMSIGDATKPEEIAFHLAGIRQTLDKKAFLFLEIDTQKLDDYATKLTNGKKKNFAGLAEAISSLSSSESKETLKAACGAKEQHASVANAYLLRQIMQKLGFDVDVNQEMLSKIYKDLKIRKPLGRKAKG